MIFFIAIMEHSSCDLKWLISNNTYFMDFYCCVNITTEIKPRRYQIDIIKRVRDFTMPMLLRVVENLV